MKLTSRPVTAGLLALVLAGAGVVGAAAAFAAGPPYEPDANSLGGIVFYDASGHVLTGGSNLSHLFDYAGVSTPAARTTTTKATLYFANPDPTKADSNQWTATQESTSSTFNPSSAAAPYQLQQANGDTKPVVTLGSTDANLSSFIGSVPANTASGYANVYQVRVKDSGAGAGNGQSATQFWSADILVNPSAGTWTVSYPALATSTDALTGPASATQTTTAGGTTSAITLMSTASPKNPGFVQFYDNGTALGTPVTTDANGVATDSITPAPVAAGNPDVLHKYTAHFAPNGGVSATDVDSNEYDYTVTAPKTATTTAVAHTGGATAFSSQSFTATVAPSAATGSVLFKDGTSTISGTVTNPSPGTYTLTTTSLAQGHHDVNAFFTGTGTYASSDSTAAPASFDLGASACKGDPNAAPAGTSCNDPQTVQTTVTAGYLTIATPYTAASPFILPAMKLNAAGTMLSTTAAFPNVAGAGGAAPFQSPLTVTSTLAGDPDWTASAVASDLSGTGATTPTGTNDVIDGHNVGITAWKPLQNTNTANTVTFFDNPAAGGVQPGSAGTVGLKAGPSAFATTQHGGNGTLTAYGQLTITAPTNTVADTYTGTITFSVA